MTDEQVTVQELVEKALQNGAITEEDAEALRAMDPDDVLENLYTYITLRGGDPDTLMREWGLAE